MHEELGCSVKDYDKLCCKIGKKTILNFLLKRNEHSNVLRLMFYMDEYGSFVGRKRPLDHLARVIFDNLDASCKKQIFNYIEYIEEGK